MLLRGYVATHDERFRLLSWRLNSHHLAMKVSDEIAARVVLRHPEGRLPAPLTPDYLDRS